MQERAWWRPFQPCLIKQILQSFTHFIKFPVSVQDGIAERPIHAPFRHSAVSTNLPSIQHGFGSGWEHISFQHLRDWNSGSFLSPLFRLCSQRCDAQICPSSESFWSLTGLLPCSAKLETCCHICRACQPNLAAVHQSDSGMARAVTSQSNLTGLKKKKN